MKNVLPTILASIVVFVAGLFAGIWIQRHQPLPPPPTGLMGEFRDMPLSGPGGRHPPRDYAQLRAELERMKPQIEEFRKKVEPIKSDFRDKLKALLNPEQQAKLAILSEHYSNTHPGSGDEGDRNRPSPPPNTGPGVPASGPAGPHFHRNHDGLESMFPIILVPITLERLTQELTLTEAQKPQVRELLIERRRKFLELIDTNPPPSARLGMLAPQVSDTPKPTANP